jgi:DNA polymerase-3 subunit delta
MIVTLTGSNGFLKKQKLAKLKKEFSDKYGAENIERIDGVKLETSQLPSLLTGASLFSSNRMVIIRDLSENKDVAEAFLGLLTSVPDEVSVILLESSLDKRTNYYKSLKKQTEFLEMAEPSEIELKKWLVDYVVKMGGSISPGDADTLIDYVGADQQRLAGEVEKLILYQPKLDGAVIEKLVERRPQSTTFQLLDIVYSGEKNRALAVLENLEKAYEDPFLIANLLIWQIQVMAAVKSAGSRPDSEIAKDTKFNPYVISKTKRLVSRLSDAQIRDLVTKTAELDLTIKLSKAQPWRVLEQYIISL